MSRISSPPQENVNTFATMTFDQRVDMFMDAAESIMSSERSQSDPRILIGRQALHISNRMRWLGGHRFISRYHNSSPISVGYRFDNRLAQTYLTEQVSLANVRYGDGTELIEGHEIQIPALRRRRASEFVVHQRQTPAGGDPRTMSRLSADYFVSFPVEREADLQAGISYVHYTDLHAVSGNMMDHAMFRDEHPELYGESLEHKLWTPEYLLGVIAVAARAIDGQTN